VWGGAISAWDADSGRIGTIAPGGALSGPDDFALGPDGSIYATEYLEGAVAAIRPDGRYEVLFGDSPKANGITIDDEGRLFVDEFRPGGRLYELDPWQPGAPRIIAELDNPNALERGPDRRLYLQDCIAGTVFSIDPDSGSIRPEFDGIGVPSAVKFDPLGRVVVSEFLTGAVFAFDLATRERSTLVELLPGIDNVCFDRQGRLFVSNSATCEIVRVSGGSIDARTGDGLLGPYGLAADGDGSVLVADQMRIARGVPGAGPAIVWQFSPTSGPHRIFDLAWTPGTLFAVSADGDLLRVDLSTGRLDVVSAAVPGQETRAIAPRGTGVIIATPDARLLGLRADGTVEWERSAGLRSVTDVSCRGNMIVACDRSAGVVAMLDKTGTRTVDGFSSPEAVAAGDGGAFVAESRPGRVSWLAFDGGSRDVLASGLPLDYPYSLPRHGRRSCLARLPDGSVAVGCAGDGSVRRLQPR
jgi:hypothetical protein